MPQPAALIAAMNPDIAASRPHSPAASAARIARKRGLTCGTWPWPWRIAHPPESSGGRREPLRNPAGQARSEPPFLRGLMLASTPGQATGLVPGRGFTVAGQCRAHTGLRWLAAAPAAIRDEGNVQAEPGYGQGSSDDQLLSCEYEILGPCTSFPLNGPASVSSTANGSAGPSQPSAAPRLSTLVPGGSPCSAIPPGSRS